jgi:hypothetical protein
MRLIFTSAFIAGLSFMPTALCWSQPPASNGAHTGPHSAAIAPPTAMKLDGVPAIPHTLALEIAPYGEFTPTRFVGWHPVEQDMLILRRAGS